MSEIVLSLRSGSSTIHQTDEVGLWLSGGLVVYGLIVPALAISSPGLAQGLVGATEGLHYLAILLSQFIALMSLVTGYVEHKDRRVLVALLVAFGLQTWVVSSSAGCCRMFLQGRLEFSWLDVAQLASPIMANAVLVWAYQVNARYRREMAEKERRRQRRVANKA